MKKQPLTLYDLKEIIKDIVRAENAELEKKEKENNKLWDWIFILNLLYAVLGFIFGALTF